MSYRTEARKAGELQIDRTTSLFLAGALLHAGDITTGAEMSPGTAQYYRANIQLVLYRIEGFHDAFDDSIIHGIALVRAVDGDRQNTVFNIQQQLFILG